MRKKLKQLMGILLSLALVLGMMPRMRLTAYAATWDGNPYTDLMNNQTKVTFNDKPWYIIADNSEAAGAGTVTLLAADESFGTSAFSDSYSNAYSSSKIKTYLDGLTASGGSFESVKDAIADTDLSDVGAGTAKLYLLSTDEANALSDNNKKFNFTGAEMGGWWLRSPGDHDRDAACVFGEYGDVFDFGNYVRVSFGVRPALKLNLSSVIFSSESGVYTFELKPTHTHSFTYSASGNTITATCEADDKENCPLKDNDYKATLTIAAGDADYTGSAYTGASITNDIPYVDGDTVGEIAYYKVNTEGATIGGMAQTGAPTDAGYYYASVTLTSGSNTYTAVKAFTIAPKALTITGATLTERNYEKDKKDVEISAVTFEGAMLNLGTDYTATAVMEDDTAGDAKSATVTVTLTNGNYSLAENTYSAATVKINKIDYTGSKTAAANLRGVKDATTEVTLPTLPAGASYGTVTNSNDTYFTVGTVSGGKLTVTAKKDFDQTTESEAKSFTVAVSGATNYNDYDVAVIITPIFKTDQTITADNVTVTYGETNKKVSAETNGDGTLSYEVTAGDDYIDVNDSTGVITTKMVGTATVVVKASETDTYAEATKEVTVTVGKAAPTVTAPTEKTLTYNGSAQQLVNAGSATGGEMYYAVTTENTAPADNLYTTSIPTGTDAGTYIVYYKVVGDANHNDTEPAYVAVTILGADSEESDTSAGGLTYNGEEQALVKAGAVEGGTLLYAVTTDETQPAEEAYSENVPAAKDAGTYYVWYYVQGDKNHNDTIPAMLTAVIAPKPVTVTTDSKSKVEGEADPALTYTVEGLVEGDTLTGALTRDAGEAAGTYAIKQGTLTAGGNYALTFKGATLTITAKPATPAETNYLLLAKLSTSGKKALKVTWTAVPGAEGYDIYFAHCGQSLQQVGSVGGSTTSYTVKGLNKYDAYKGYVVAWKTVNGVKTNIARSPLVHAVTGGYTNKYANPKKVTVRKAKVKLTVGKTAKIKASVTKAKSSRKLMDHESKLRYYSSNPAVATVSANGRITAVGAGSCKVYVVAINGARAAVKVTVK